MTIVSFLAADERVLAGSSREEWTGLGGKLTHEWPASLSLQSWTSRPCWGSTRTPMPATGRGWGTTTHRHWYPPPTHPKQSQKSSRTGLQMYEFKMVQRRHVRSLKVVNLTQCHRYFNRSNAAKMGLENEDALHHECIRPSWQIICHFHFILQVFTGLFSLCLCLSWYKTAFSHT